MKMQKALEDAGIKKKIISDNPSIMESIDKMDCTFNGGNCRDLGSNDRLAEINTLSISIDRIEVSCRLKQLGYNKEDAKEIYDILNTDGIIKIGRSE